MQEPRLVPRQERFLWVPEMAKRMKRDVERFPETSLVYELNRVTSGEASLWSLDDDKKHFAITFVTEHPGKVLRLHFVYAPSPKLYAKHHKLFMMRLARVLRCEAIETIARRGFERTGLGLGAKHVANVYRIEV